METRSHLVHLRHRTAPTRPPWLTVSWGTCTGRTGLTIEYIGLDAQRRRIPRNHPVMFCNTSSPNTGNGFVEPARIKERSEPRRTNLKAARRPPTQAPVQRTDTTLPFSLPGFSATAKFSTKCIGRCSATIKLSVNFPTPTLYLWASPPHNTPQRSLWSSRIYTAEGLELNQNQHINTQVHFTLGNCRPPRSLRNNGHDHVQARIQASDNG